MTHNFCPFIKATCRKDCAFYHPSNSDECLLAGRLNLINDTEYDQLEEINTKLREINSKIQR